MLTFKNLIFFLIIIILHTSCLQAEENISKNILKEILNPPQTSNSRALKYALLLQQAGFSSDQVKTQTVKNSSGADALNVYIELNPSKRNDLYIISCHTDFAAGTSGIIDNWSGCVMSAALSAALIDKDLKCGFIFAGFCLEEEGQLGSKYFFNSLSKRYRKQIKAVINLECLGLGRLNTWSNRSSDILEKLLQQAALKNNSIAGLQVLYNLKSDADIFLNNSIPAITIHSLNGFNNNFINSALDNPGALKKDEFYKSFSTLKYYLLYLDQFDRKISINNNEFDLKQAQCSLHSFAAVNDNKLILKNLNRGSIEYKAGLRSGDIIRKINGVHIQKFQEITSISNSLSVGDKLSITVDRAEKHKKFELTY
ncbi:MAG: M28 family metallopeptidase [Planctomycetota bacterium]|jgi:hypothetical protein